LPLHRRQSTRGPRRRHQPSGARTSRPRRARRLRPTDHRLGGGTPPARGRAGIVEHVLLRNADAPAAEAIWLFSTPVIRGVARSVSQMFGNWLFRRMYWWQVGGFIRDADVRREFVPLLYQQFDATPSARPAFFRLNEDLLPTVQSRTQMIPKL